MALLRFRLNIGSLVGFILICGVAFGALKESSDWWERGTFTLMLLVLLTSVLMATHRTGARRSFWFGFALFGWVYLGLSLITPIEARLVSSQALAYLHSQLPGRPPQTFTVTFTTPGSYGTPIQLGQAPIASMTGVQVNTTVQPPIRLWNVTNSKFLSAWGDSEENFVKIGHTLIALLLAWLGGMLSRRLARGRAPAEGSLQASSVDSPASHS